MTTPKRIWVGWGYEDDFSYPTWWEKKMPFTEEYVSARESRNEIERLQNELADVVDVVKLALIEFERITGDKGFEPDRWQKRIEVVKALRQATAIDDLPF